jgi:putative hemolysin
METFHFVYLILFGICLVAAALFCSIETAFISIQKLHLHHLIESDNAKAKMVARIINKPEKFLATVLLCINFFETAVATLGTVLAVSFLGENIGAAVATIFITILTLIFAELIPKSLAARYGETIALQLAGFIQFTSKVLYPFVFVLNHIGLRITGVARGGAAKKPTISEEEFRTAINVGEAEGIWEEEEAEMLHNVFEFADRPVSEIMTPRMEIIWVQKGSNLSQLFDIYRNNPHTKFPVFTDNTDNAIGVIFMKDILLAQADDLISKESGIDELIRPIYFVPETKLLGTLLAEMKKDKYTIVLVVDEYGGIAGMVTIDQIVEEIVGEIRDEIIDEEEDIVSIDTNVFEIDGALRVEEANDELGLDIPEGQYETLAGFVMSHLGRIPHSGEHLRYKNLKITIVEMKGMKIERIRITREADAAVKS